MSEETKNAKLSRRKREVAEKIATIEGSLGPAKAAYDTALQTYDRLLQRKISLQITYTNLDRELAELDGRTTVVRSGASGQKKSKKKGGDTTFNLKDYLSTLTKEQKEAFVQSLLNP